MTAQEEVVVVLSTNSNIEPVTSNNTYFMVSQCDFNLKNFRLKTTKIEFLIVTPTYRKGLF